MHIIPLRLRRLRNERQWSRQELATRSRVSLKQIQRLEDPEQASANVRAHTLRRLADAFDVEQQELTGEPPTPEGSKSARVGAALDPGVRLAYELIERRYGVTIGHLLQMAPLYFALLAEGSLEWRRAELAELRAAIDRVNELGNFGNKRFALHAWHAAGDSHAEAEAIERGDLFNDPLPNDYEYEPGEDWDGSPFADYLRKLAKDLGKPELVDLEPYSHGRVSALPGVPAYRIYTKDLSKIASLQSDAMYALHTGEACISEIPDHLMADDAADDRRLWLEDRLSPQSRQRLDLHHRIVAAIRLSRDDVNADSTVQEGAEQ